MTQAALVLWLMFRHDLSAFRRVLPARDGTCRKERVESAFTRPGWAPYLFECGTHPFSRTNRPPWPAHP
jgi:hypothetical protein